MKKVCGVGINDTDIKKREMLKCYDAWKNMIQRCYNPKIQEEYPTYGGCYVCEEWLLLSNYKKWYDTNYIENYHVDKDLLVLRNKVYSPQTCRFVPESINNLIIDSAKSRGDLMIGVTDYSHYNKNNPFYATCNQFNSKTGKYKKSRHIGYYSTELEAHEAYKLVKERTVKEVATYYYERNLISEEIYNALMVWKVVV